MAVAFGKLEEIPGVKLQIIKTQEGKSILNKKYLLLIKIEELTDSGY